MHTNRTDIIFTRSKSAYIRLVIFSITAYFLLRHSHAALADATNPTLDDSEPSDNAYAVSISAAIVLTFSEAITGDASEITLYQKQGDTELDSTVTISGNTVTINPDADLSPSGGYYIKILATAIDDIAGNS